VAGEIVMIRTIRRYLAVRRATGYKLEGATSVLLAFARFAKAHHQTHVRTETVQAWARTVPSGQVRNRKYALVRRFAEFAHAEDPKHEIPAALTLAPALRRRTPHIYRTAETTRLLAAARAMLPRSSIRPKTYEAVLSLLVATGLRVGEVLSLHVEDVTQDGLVIRETKFSKTRLVPLHPTARAGITAYLHARRRLGGAHSFVFVLGDGRPLRYGALHATFHRLVRQARIRARSGYKFPRLVDFRHTFAVRSLERCAADRVAVSRHMLALSTYLGHVSVECTYWYLQATPGLMRDVAALSEARHADVRR
jgi:integrase